MYTTFLLFRSVFHQNMPVYLFILFDVCYPHPLFALCTPSAHAASERATVKETLECTLLVRLNSEYVCLCLCSIHTKRFIFTMNQRERKAILCAAMRRKGRANELNGKWKWYGKKKQTDARSETEKKNLEHGRTGKNEHKHTIIMYSNKWIYELPWCYNEIFTICSRFLYVILPSSSFLCVLSVCLFQRWLCGIAFEMKVKN